MSTRRYLSETPEFLAAVERRRAEALRRAPWPCRIVMAAIDGYLSELQHMLRSDPICLGHGE